MRDTREVIESDKTNELPTREPLFRRYQIKIKAGVRAGAVPSGRPPLGF